MPAKPFLKCERLELADRPPLGLGDTLELEATAQAAKRDDETCRNYGFEPGMPAYGDCRIKLVSLRLQAASLIVQATRPPVVIDQPRASAMTRCQTNGGITDCQSY